MNCKGRRRSGQTFYCDLIYLKYDWFIYRLIYLFILFAFYLIRQNSFDREKKKKKREKFVKNFLISRTRFLTVLKHLSSRRFIAIAFDKNIGREKGKAG